MTHAAHGSLFEAYRERRTFSSFDGLRCLCILAVVWHHSPDDLDLARVFPAVRMGFLGVDLFFVISGFLIVMLLLRERERTGTVSLRNFWIRRSLRIFPVYFGLLAVLALLFSTVMKHGSQASEFFDSLPWLLTYTSNWAAIGGIMGITWSLSAEEQFYAVWPPIERWAPRVVPFALAGLIGLSQAIHFGLFDGPMARLGFGPYEPVMLRQTTFTPILLGVAAAHLMHSPASFARVAQLLGHRAVPVLLLLAIVVASCLFPDDLRGWPRLTMHLLMVAWVLSCVVREDHALRAFLTLRPVARIGVLSYGIYLYHLIAADVVTRVLAKLPFTVPMLALAGNVVLSVGIAHLSHRFYERHWLALKERFQGTPVQASGLASVDARPTP